MHLTPEMAPQFLQGTRVLLGLLTRETDRGNLGFTLWTIMQQEGVIDKYFHEEFLEHHGAFRGDLACFMQHYYLFPRLVLVVMDATRTTPDAEGLLGMIDFDVSRSHRHAKFGIWMRRNRSADAYEAGILATSWAFAALPIDTLFGVSPHPYIARFAKKCGWDVLAELPHYYMLKEHSAPAYMATIRREVWEKRDD